jgi:hypothetical protein
MKQTQRNIAKGARTAPPVAEVVNVFVLDDADCGFVAEMLRIASTDLLSCARMIERRCPGAQVIERFRMQSERARDMIERIDAR